MMRRQKKRIFEKQSSRTFRDSQSSFPESLPHFVNVKNADSHGRKMNRVMRLATDSGSASGGSGKSSSQPRTYQLRSFPKSTYDWPAHFQ